MEMDRLVDVAAHSINSILKDNYYVDDLGWGDTCVRIPIYKCNPANPLDCKCVASYTFIYEDDEYLYGDLKEQYNAWLDEVKDSLHDSGLLK